MKRILNFIDGEFRPPCSGRYLPDVNPATGQVIAEIAESGPEDVDAAVAAASRAFASWRRTPAEERSRLLLRVAELIEENFDELARLESEDSGKPIALARRMDVPRAILNFRFFATAILHAETPSPHDGRSGAQLHPPAAPRRRRADLALEPAAVPSDLEDRSGHRRGELLRGEAVGAHAADRRQARRADPGGGHSARRRQHRARPGSERRPRPHVASERPAHLVHRGNEDGRGRDGPRGTALQEGVPGARREEPEHRVRGRRSRAGRRDVDPVELRQPGGDLPLRIAPVRREDDLRRVPRPLSGGNEEAPDRRPAGRFDRRGRARQRGPPAQGRRLRRARERGRGHAFSPAESVRRISRSASGTVTFSSRR